jgi:hypothetical protein
VYTLDDFDCHMYLTHLLILQLQLPPTIHPNYIQLLNGIDEINQVTKLPFVPCHIA